MAEAAENLRLFVALEVPVEVKARLAELQAALRRAVPRLHASWTRPEQMHLTLRFLGSVPALALPSLVETLQTSLPGWPPLELELAGVGAFPGWLRPRVLWAGVVDRSPEDGLKRLQRAVQSATDGFAAEPPEAEFHPHVTLARVKRDPGRGVLEAWARDVGEGVLGRWTVREVVLFRSQLEIGGSRHTRLAGMSLGMGPDA